MPNAHPLDRVREALPSLPAAPAAAAEWVLRHAVQAATMGIAEIATAAGSSPASVNRMARAAGYPGFIELKAELAGVMRTLLDPVQKLRDEQHRVKLTPTAQYAAMARANLEQLVRDNSESTLGQAARALSEAERIVLLGFGSTTHMAAWLADALLPFVANVSFVAGPGGTERAASRMARIGKRDVLVAASFPRYSRDVLVLARYARDRGAKVLALVDSHAAPLAQEADLLLLAPCAHPVLSSSYVAAQTLCEALVAEVMRLNPRAVTLATDLAQSLLPYLTSPLPSRR
jgi:DNA-binding MurR/RpiR family transcriptional regulator